MVDSKTFDSFVFVLTPDLLTNFEKNPLFDFFKSTMAKGDKKFVYSACQKIQFSVSGYDTDPREIYEIPEFRLFCRILSISFPYFFYFLPKTLSKLIVLGALEAKNIGEGLSYVDPEKEELFVRERINYAFNLGIHVGHSEEEMRAVFS